MKKPLFNRFSFMCISVLIYTLGGIINAQAARMDFLDEVVLVPYVEFASNQETTVVGLTAADPGTIYWAFFDANGIRRASGTKTVVDLQKIAFVWASEAPSGAFLANEPGFLVFAMDTNNSGTITEDDGNFLKASAFFVNQNDSDVAYIPVIDVDDSELSSSNPNNWTTNPITAIPSIETGRTAEFSYLIAGSPDDGDDTDLYIFTTADPGANQSMSIHDGDGNFVDATIFTANTHLNIIDPERINNLPQQYFGDGFFLWQIPQGSNGATIYAFIFSIVESNFFGAAQTLLGSY